MKNNRVNRLITVIGIFLFSITMVNAQNTKTNKKALNVTEFANLEREDRAAYMTNIIHYFVLKYRKEGVTTGEKKYTEFASYLHDNYEVDGKVTEHQKAAISDALDALNQAVNTHPNETVAKIFLAHALKKQKKEKEKKN